MFDKQPFLKATPADQAQRFLTLRGKAEAEIKADPAGSEAWVHVSNLLEFIELAGAAFSRTDDFVAATRNWLLHEHNRLVKSGAQLPMSQGSYEDAVRKYDVLRKEFAGITAPSEATLKARADSLVKDLTKTLNENASLKASSEFLQKRLDKSGIEDLRLCASKADLAAQEATTRATMLEKKQQATMEKLVAVQAELKELEANSLDETDYDALEEKVTTLEARNQALSIRLKVTREVYTAQVRELARQSVSPLPVKRAKRKTP